MRGLFLVVVASAVLAVLYFDADAPVGIANLSRHQLADGVELIDARLVRGRTDCGRLVAVYAEPDKVDPKLLTNPEKAPLESLDGTALVIANAGYFTPDHRPTGLLVTDGNVLSPLVPTGGGAGTGVLVLDDRGVHLLQRERVQKDDIDGARLAIQAGPRLIEPGGVAGIRSDDGARANRTVLGADARGRLVLLATYGTDDGKRDGATLFELMNLIGPDGLGKAAPGLGLDLALNLDGGQSTGFFLHHGDRAIRLPEAARVFSAFALSIRP